MSNPAAQSKAYQAMAPTWETITDILVGEDAVKRGAQRYLPRYEGESEQEYTLRLASTPWQPEFEDALNNITAKPFSRDVMIKEPANPPEKISTLYEDIDTRGNSLTVFAQQVFHWGIAYGQHHIFIDMPPPPQQPTALTDQQALPYWTHVKAVDLIALYTQQRGNQEIVTHARFWEQSTVVNDFEETSVSKIRVLEQRGNQAVWELWGTYTNEKKEEVWRKEKEGVFKGIDKIPFVSFFTGERLGAQYCIPPLKNLAGLQIDLFRTMSRKEEIETYAGSPMLSANGFTLPQGEDIKVGPRRVLIAPPGLDGQATSWDFVEPNPSNIAEIRKSVEEKIDNIRRLGLQPLTQRAGRPTATGQSIEGAKSHTVVQQWAELLNDTIERGFSITTDWLGLEDNIQTEVSTDFYVIPYAQPPLDALTKARERGDLSLETFWLSLRRFDVLPPDFDAEKEHELLAEEEANKPIDESVIPPIPPQPPQPGNKPVNKGQLQ